MWLSGRGLPTRRDARRCSKETEKALGAPESETRPRGETAGEEEDMLGLGRAPAVGGGGNDDDDPMSRGRGWR
jgi:hypothetical protein